LKLYRTVILPTDDAELATRVLHSLIAEQGFVLFFALGTGQTVEAVVLLADELAGGSTSEPTHRKVVWIRDPEPVAEALETLASKPDLPGVLDPHVQAFSLSLQDLVCDVIRKDEGPIGRGRVFKAFVLAERGL
jgi:hypothetical protein